MGKIIMDAAFSLSLFLGSVYLWFVADGFQKFARYKNIDSDFWPKILLVMIGTLGLILLCQSLSTLRLQWRLRRAVKAAADSNFEDPDFDWKKLVCAAGLVVLYFAGLQSVGFVLSTVVFLALAIRLIGYGNRLLRLSFPFVFTAVVTLVFVKVLSLSLPRGTGVFETFSRLLY